MLYLCYERLPYFSPPIGIEKQKNVATMDNTTVLELAGEVMIYPEMQKLTVHLFGKPFVGEVRVQCGHKLLKLSSGDCSRTSPL